MTTLSREDFLEFCKAQGNRRINNRGWSTCAIGSYLKSKGIDVTDGRALVRDLVPEEHSIAVEAFMASFSSDVRFGLDRGCYGFYSELVGDIL